MSQTFDLALGEEKAVHLPPLPSGDWGYAVEGMASAVEVRKLWAADPYPEDDEDEERPRPTPDVVFMIRGIAPGSATVQFTGSGSNAEPRTVRVVVRERGS